MCDWWRTGGLSRLLEQVAAGERIVISKAGTPIADLIPHQAATVTFGGLKGEVAYSDQAFDLDPDIKQTFYGPDPGYAWDLAISSDRTAMPVTASGQGLVQRQDADPARRLDGG